MTRILMPSILSLGMLMFAATPQTREQGTMTTGRKSQTEPSNLHAKAKITVQSSEAKPYDQTTSATLVEIHIDERFTGDIDGESTVRALAGKMEGATAISGLI